MTLRKCKDRSSSVLDTLEKKEGDNGEVMSHAGREWLYIYKVRPQKKGINGGPCTTFSYSSISNLDKWNQRNLKEEKEKGNSIFHDSKERIF